MTMGQALYRKYRSKSMDEIVGQEHITQTLDQAIKSGRISHAYLFTGPRGVGKTSIARILAHQINNLPYTDDSSHMDIIEIDAASNRRIDEIRELRDKVYVAPTSAKYKVYIIDEVHMLTKEAFNALLKTLEEPPAHVVFILATTDAHKLPETIVSRTQRYSFRPVDKDKVVAHLKSIAKTEGIEVSDAALQILAEHGEGSFRDSISLLDQASSHGQKLELSDVQSLLGIPPVEALNQLANSLSVGDSADLMKQISQLYDSGYQATTIAKQLAGLLRTQLLNGTTTLDTHQTLQILEQLVEVPIAHDPERYLEIALLKTLPVSGSTVTSTEASYTRKVISKPPKLAEPVLETKPGQESGVSAKHKASKTIASKKMPGVQSLDDNPTKSSEKSDKSLDETLWPEILSALKQKYNTLYGIARMAQPDFRQPGTLRLSLSFAFHQKRINEPRNRQIIADIVQELTGQHIQIECLVDKNASPSKVNVPAAKAATTPKTSNLSTISNIFGGAELLES